MEASRRFLAILLADLRERTRSPRFWALLAAMVVLTWWCFPGPGEHYMILSVSGGARGAYSSAWVGMVLAMAYTMLLGLGGFYLVRGTLVRDIETRVWQLLVATPMTRAGFLLAKWASHMVVLSIIVVVGLGVGLVAQWLRAEDHSINLWQLAKPVLLLSLPGLAVTSMAAVWFDLLPWLRRTAGNVLFFILWITALSVAIAQLETPGSWLRTGWLSDPNGLVMVARDIRRVRIEQTGKPQEFGLSLGSPRPATGPVVFDWQQWKVRPMDVLGRALWLLFALGSVALAAPLLDWAAARGAPAAKLLSRTGSRLRWLDRVLMPFARGSFGVLAVAELKLALRERRRWWWLAALIAIGLQTFGSGDVLRIGILLAWLLPLDVLSRAILREKDHRTGELVFTAAGTRGRLLGVRFACGLALVLGLSLPGILRLGSISPTAALAALLVAVSIVSWGLCLGALCRNPRPFELLLVFGLYLGMQGAPLFDPLAHAQFAALWHGAALIPAWLALAWAWPRLARR